MRELAKKQKQEGKKERKLARQNPQPDENGEALIGTDADADAPTEADAAPAATEQ
jgi:hypothetical protein